jgi:hypothetical protein
MVLQDELTQKTMALSQEEPLVAEAQAFKQISVKLVVSQLIVAQNQTPQSHQSIHHLLLALLETLMVGLGESP